MTMGNGVSNERRWQQQQHKERLKGLARATTKSGDESGWKKRLKQIGVLIWEKTQYWFL